MRFYTGNHLDQQGQTLLHRNIKSRPDDFLRAVIPFRDDLVVREF